MVLTASVGMLGCATTQAPAARNAVVPAGTSAVSTASQPNGTRGEPFSSPENGFELDQPDGNGWAVATNVTSPEGRPIPVVVAHPESGAQIVVQVSQPDSPPEDLAKMLRMRLVEEMPLEIGDTERIEMESGSEAFGFPFTIQGEANGRVAVIQVGEQIVLLVASWPQNAGGQIVRDIDAVVRSVRLPAGATPTMLRPDKA